MREKLTVQSKYSWSYSVTETPSTRQQVMRTTTAAKIVPTNTFIPSRWHLLLFVYRSFESLAEFCGV